MLQPTSLGSLMVGYVGSLAKHNNKGDVEGRVSNLECLMQAKNRPKNCR